MAETMVKTNVNTSHRLRSRQNLGHQNKQECFALKAEYPQEL